MCVLFLLCFTLKGDSPVESLARPINGVIISCQTYGREWASPGFAQELTDLKKLGVNTVSIHPYAGLARDGQVRTYDKGVPDFVTLPQATSRQAGMRFVMKPHLAYWRSGFSWRGEIRFSGEDLKRFQNSYRSFIFALAEASPDVDYFIIGTEIEQLTGTEHRAYWLDLINGVRQRTQAKIGYGANWDRLDWVSFWDAVDFIGVQAYFPVSEHANPQRADLEAGWDRILEQVDNFRTRYRRPVLFTELGYNCSVDAAREPWTYHESWGDKRPAAEALQALCYDVALSKIQKHGDGLWGCLLWKWFVGDGRGENFLLNTPTIRQVIQKNWAEPHP
ncbi:MAG: hypothetical protein H6510_11300 [Acidobacteria bacterium]|nr:hypothetical protein [Acidobacteriota bacterium]MCB9398391.1 hypothetical protein [Acidobacteriota bacterium]